jgi:putative hemolysin
MDILFTFAIMIIALLFEGFFSGTEIGVVSADRLLLRQNAAKGSRGAKLALKMLGQPEWLLSTTLVGTNISVVTNTTVATALVIQLFGPSYSWMAVVIVAPLIWVFGEIVPKSVFQQKADEITPRVIYLLLFCSFLFYPILVIFSLLTRLLTKLLGEKKANIFTLREQIISMLHMSQPGGEVKPNQVKMIRRMFNFTETPAIRVMVPLIDIVSVEKGVTCGEVVQIASYTAHRHLAVYDNRVDNIIGRVHSLELLGVAPDTPIKAYIRPVRYVGGTDSILHLLQELKKTDEAFAVVVDEYGAAKGIVTAEDIMEEVVGDMNDEFEAERQSTQWVRKVSDQEYVVSGRIKLRTLKDRLGIKIRKGEFATLAGYLLEKAHEVPAQGTVIEAHGIAYTILKRTDHLIQEIGISRKE